MYENQKEVDKIQEQIQQIFPELRISSFILDKNTVTSVGIVLPIKGNSKVIKRLEELGWVKSYRKKVRTDNDRYTRCQYDGYIMHQHMQLDVRFRV